MAEDRIIKPKEAAAILGVTVATLNNWDEKLKPSRTPGNQRRYSLALIERIKHQRTPDVPHKVLMQRKLDLLKAEITASVLGY